MDYVNNYLVEAVPNFSTSDQTIIDKIVNSIERHSSAKVLHVDPDKDYNRTVVTLVTTLNNIVDVSYSAITTALKHIDLRSHEGEHPRIGAVDVFPLIPLRSTTFQDIIPKAKEIAERIGGEIKMPIYLYGKSSINKNRESLFEIRKGQYENLQKKLKDPKWKPDYGSDSFNSKSGALVIGVRQFLIAYNVNLQTDDVHIAKTIAGLIRTSGYIDAEGNRIKGKLNKIQAMGVTLKRKRGTFTQVSTNILDFENSSSLHDVYKSCYNLAKKYGTKVTGSEIVGLIPKKAVDNIVKICNLKNQEEIISYLGLNDLYEFDLNKKVLDILIDRYFQ